MAAATLCRTSSHQTIGKEAPARNAIASLGSVGAKKGISITRIRRRDYESVQRREDVRIRATFAAREVLTPRRTDDPPAFEESFKWAGAFVAEFDDAVFVPRGALVFLSDGTLVRESLVRRKHLDQVLRQPAPFLAARDAAQDIDADGSLVMVDAQRKRNYSHWVLDVVSRIWLADLVMGSNTGLLTMMPAGGFQREMLKALGLEDRVVSGDGKPVRVPKMIFAQGLAWGSAQAISPMCVDFGRWMASSMGLDSPDPTRRVHVLREDADQRRVTNEEELAERLAERGFESVSLAGLSVRGQAQLMRSAAVVVAPHGAGLTNQLFCSDRTMILEMFPNGGIHDSAFRRMAVMLGQPYRWLEGEADGRVASNPNDSDFRVDPGALLDVLDACGFT